MEDKTEIYRPQWNLQGGQLFGRAYAMRDSLDVLGGKWKLMILRFLTNRTHQVIHFKKMICEIEGISSKMLSKELKEL